MKIALNAWFLDQPTTGSGQYLAHLLAEFAAHPAVHPAGHRFLLCEHAGTTRSDRPDLFPPAFEWQILRTPFDAGATSTVRRSSTVLRRHLAKVWFEQVSFPHACRRWGADLVHVPYWASPYHCSIPTVVTIHDLIPVLLPAYGGGALGRLYIRLVSLSARRAAHVLTDSHASRRDIIAHLGIPSQRVEAIHLAAGSHFKPVSDLSVLERVRSRYTLPPRYLLYLGGFDVRKNVSAILRAYARLDMDDVPLVIAGKLPAKDSAFAPHPQQIVDDLGISDRVRLAGWIEEEDKPAIYSMATGFVFPSTYEGFGLPPLEAMSCGTPAIVSNRSSLPEVVGEGGMQVDPDDLDGLAMAMRKLATDIEWGQRLRTLALAQASRFSWHNTAQTTLAAYERAAPQNLHGKHPDTSGQIPGKETSLDL